MFLCFITEYIYGIIQPIQIDDESESNHVFGEQQPSSSFAVSSVIKNTLQFHQDNEQQSNSSESDESVSCNKKTINGGVIKSGEKSYRDMKNISKSKGTDIIKYIEENHSEGLQPQSDIFQELPSQNNLESKQCSQLSQKNTLGKQYPEQFKRQFVRNIFDQTKDMNKKSLCNYICQEAHRIRVYPNEVAIWMGIYRIAFRVQQENNFKRISQEKSVRLVEESLVQYLNRNPTQKKYRFIRVANGSFRALQIRKSTGDRWLQKWIYNFKDRLNPKINLERLIKGRKGGHCLSYRNQRLNQFGHITQLFNLGDQNWKQLKDKHSIVKMIDRKIQCSIDKALEDVQKSTGIDYGQLQVWYYKYGKFKFDEVHGDNVSDQNDSDSRDLDQIQMPIVEFVRKYPGCTFEQILFQVHQILNHTRIAYFEKEDSVYEWLDKFLDEQFKLVDSGYYLK